MDERPSLLRRARTGLDIMASVAMIAVGVVVLNARFASGPDRTEDLPFDPIPLEGAFLEGHRSAAGALILFTDFQCPFCGRFARETLESVKAAYVDSGRLLLSIRHLPLEAIHPDARFAAAAAICADGQGRFWEVNDAFFADPKRLKITDIEEHARRSGLDVGTLVNCANDKGTNAAIDTDLELARRLGIRSTPAIIVGKVRSDGRIQATHTFRGAVAATALKPALDAVTHR